MTKLQLIEELAAKLGIKLSDCERFLDGLITAIYEENAAGRNVNIKGFGNFSVSHRQARIGVHPRTGERITIPELRTPSFHAGEGYKQAVRLQKSKPA